MSSGEGRQAETPEFPISYGKYELLERIGDGGMAEVFRARMAGVAGFEKIVVIKRILPHLARSSHFVEMFVSEAKLAAQVQHKNVVQIFELGQRESGELFMAMEYVNGTDLRRILSSAGKSDLRIPAWFSVHTICEVLDGLAHAHDLCDLQGRPRNLVHRDVTPSNVFVSHLSEIKLGDFGVARDDTMEARTRAGQLKGKLAYMSPEQLYSKPLDGRSDVFAAAVVLWECLTQRRLFGGRPEIETMNLICTGARRPPSQLNPEVPRELDRIVLEALEPDVRKRTPSARDFQSRLLDVLPLLRRDIRPRDLRLVIDVLLGKRPLEEAGMRRRSDPIDPAELQHFSVHTPLGGFALPRPAGGPLDPFVSPLDSLLHTPFPVTLGPGAAQSPIPFSYHLAMPSGSGAPVQALPYGRPGFVGDILPPPRGTTGDLSPPLEFSTPSTDLPRVPSGDLPFEPAGVVSTGDLPRLPSGDLPPLPPPHGTGDLIRRSANGEDLELRPKVDDPLHPVRYVGPHPFWLRNREGGMVGPASYGEIHRLLRAEARARETERCALSANRERWLSVGNFGQLSGQDPFAYGELDPLEVEAEPGQTGVLADTSVAAIFAALTRNTAHGRLYVVHDDEQRTMWRIDLAHGLPIEVRVNDERLQLPLLLLNRRLVPADRMSELLHRTVLEGRPLIELASEIAGRDLSVHRASFMKERLLKLFQVENGHYAFSSAPPAEGPEPFAGSLLQLLPELVHRTKSAEWLRARLEPDLAREFNVSDDFRHAVMMLSFNKPQLECAARFMHRQPLGRALEQAPAEQQRMMLTLAHVFIEADLLLPTAAE